MAEGDSGEDPSSSDDRLTRLLQDADLEIEGHLSGASNATLRCTIDDDGAPLLCVYKPRRGERPLWDFPTGSLGHREVATGVLDRFLGWNLVPITVWREHGPLGPGMCQVWVDDDPDRPAVDVVRPDDWDASWKIVLEAVTYDGSDVLLVHEDTAELQRIAVLDLVANNADRKGGHILRQVDGTLRGIDHGLTFHVEEKVRTVLWGWAGEDIPREILDSLLHLQSALGDPQGDIGTLRDWLSHGEWSALVDRVDRLIADPVFPDPRGGEPALPWPPM